MKALENDQCLVSKTGNKFTTITICNYDSYQSIEKYDGQQTGSKRASRGHQTGTTNNNNNKNKENNIYIQQRIFQKRYINYKKCLQCRGGVKVQRDEG